MNTVGSGETAKNRPGSACSLVPVITQRRTSHQHVAGVMARDAVDILQVDGASYLDRRGSSFVRVSPCFVLYKLLFRVRPIWAARPEG